VNEWRVLLLVDGQLWQTGVVGRTHGKGEVHRDVFDLVWGELRVQLSGVACPVRLLSTASGRSWLLSCRSCCPRVRDGFWFSSCVVLGVHCMVEKKYSSSYRNILVIGLRW
jgi:hypothetical protein